MVRYLLLGLLRGGEALHGYALVRAYRHQSGVSLNAGNVYRELRRLAAENLVRPLASCGEADPRRLAYTITNAGSAAFDAWFADPSADCDLSTGERLSARAVFLANVDVRLARRLLDRCSNQPWQRTKQLESEREAALATYASGNDRSLPLRAVLAARRLRHVTADLDSVEELRKVYEAWLAETGRASQEPPLVPAHTGRRSAPRQRRVLPAAQA
jgi:DNA-binding PadR family transcriptional regulator